MKFKNSGKNRKNLTTVFNQVRLAQKFHENLILVISQDKNILASVEQKIASDDLGTYFFNKSRDIFQLIDVHIGVRAIYRLGLIRLPSWRAFLKYLIRIVVKNVISYPFCFRKF